MYSMHSLTNAGIAITTDADWCRRTKTARLSEAGQSLRAAMRLSRYGNSSPKVKQGGAIQALIG